jgi:monoterpene epsilon-lactone hydrolase
LEQRRAAFALAGRLHPLPDDVVVTDVTAGGVPAHWLAAPGADTGRVLLFLHDGGYELGSLRSDGELAAQLGRASGMRVLFPEYRLAPEHPFPAAIDDVLTAWHWLRTEQDLPAASMAVAGASAGGQPPRRERQRLVLPWRVPVLGGHRSAVPGKVRLRGWAGRRPRA